MLLQNSGLELALQSSSKIISNSGVCLRTYPHDYQVKITGNQTVALVFQNEVLRTTDVLHSKLQIK